MSSTTRGSALAPRLLVARAAQSVGWSGLVGVVLLAAAVLVGASAWRARLADLHSAVLVIDRPTPVRLQASQASQDLGLPTPPEMPEATNIPRLLVQLEGAAVQNGLEWRSAGYRLIPPTASLPGSLEVRCTVTGPYPRLRGMLVQMLQTIPALALRDFSASRPNAEAVDVEAKLVLAVFLRDPSTPIALPTEAPR